MRFISFIYPGCIAQHGAHTRVVVGVHPVYTRVVVGVHPVYTQVVYTRTIPQGGVYPNYTSGWVSQGVYTMVGIPGCIYHGGYPKGVQWGIPRVYNVGILGCTMVGIPGCTMVGIPGVYNGGYL